MLTNNNMLEEPGYYKTVTSSIDWCEPNYTHSYYIAEFYNSFSNILFIISGIYGMILSIKLGYEKRYWIQYLFNIIVGLGSFGFHATLQFEKQQLDESPMVFAVIFLFYIMLMTDAVSSTTDKRWYAQTLARKLILIFLTVYACVFSRLHYQYRWTTFFQIHFGIWCVSTFVIFIGHYRRLRKKNPNYDLDRVVVTYILTVLVGTIFWNLDFHFCESLHWIKGHAIWHILLGINSWFGPTFTVYVRSDALDMNPQIRWFCYNMLPYVEIQKLS
jgi:dihydroceramidase